MADDGAVPTGAPDGAVEAESTEPAEAVDERVAADADAADAAEVSPEEPAADRLDEGEPAEADVAQSLAGSEGAGSATRWPSSRTFALIGGLVAVLVLAGLSGWLGYRSYENHQAKDRRETFLQVARQGAVNLTTIDFEHADDDVKRIVDSSTGQFYDEFQKRAQPFVEVVKQVKSKSVGTVTEAGLQIPDGESASTVPTSAEVLVAVTVNTSIVNQPEQAPRAWRMRLQVQEDTDGQAKIAKVEFVP